MRHAGLVAFRGDDDHLVRETSGDPLQHGEAWGVDAVVIGDENAHFFFSPAIRMKEFAGGYNLYERRGHPRGAAVSPEAPGRSGSSSLSD